MRRGRRVRSCAKGDPLLDFTLDLRRVLYHGVVRRGSASQFEQVGFQPGDEVGRSGIARDDLRGFFRRFESILR